MLKCHPDKLYQRGYIHTRLRKDVHSICAPAVNSPLRTHHKEAIICSEYHKHRYLRTKGRTLLGNWLTSDGLMLIARVLGFSLAVPLHEAAHAFVSDKLGDPTARRMGRLTLNPIKHIDVFGLLAMMLIGIGWAKPVPVDPRYYKNRKVGMALTAAAGPLSNLILAFFAIIVYKIVYYAFLWSAIDSGSVSFPEWNIAVVNILFYFVLINVTLALFNLIPFPPLDGSRILGLALPDSVNMALAKVERYTIFILFGVLFLVPQLTGFSPLSWLLGDATSYITSAIDWLTGWVDMIFTGIMQSMYLVGIPTPL